MTEPAIDPMQRALALVALVSAIAPLPVLAGGDTDAALNTSGWQYQAAAIVAGEAPADCAECRILTACQIVRDARQGNPWAVVTPGPERRWHGSRTPSEVHLAAVNAALNGACVAYPSCRFLGNARDLQYWQGMNWVDEVVGFCSEHGCSICVVEVERDGEEEAGAPGGGCGGDQRSGQLAVGQRHARPWCARGAGRHAWF